MKVYVVLHTDDYGSWDDSYSVVSVRDVFLNKPSIESLYEEIWVERGHPTRTGERDKRYREGMEKKVIHTVDTTDDEDHGTYGCCRIIEHEVNDVLTRR